MQEPEEPVGRQSNRRTFMRYFAAIGLGGTLLPGILWAWLSRRSSVKLQIDVPMIEAAEKIAGLEFTPEQRKLIVQDLEDYSKNLLKRYQTVYRALRKSPLPNAVFPAIEFNPRLSGMTFDTQQLELRYEDHRPRKAPPNLEEAAYWPVLDLAASIKAGAIRSFDLTVMYLDRLKRLDPILNCVVTLTEKRALEQARQADAEIAAGRYRGLLHGIPWGAKDLLAVRGYPTTWGAAPFREQRFDFDAAVVERLDAAGAILVAKLAMGELARGDRWFGGTTHTPWDPKRGASGSSSGPAAAVSAGLVGFAIGSETCGSILDPSTRCGVVGLRPTFGRVGRYGAMTLSWSMDKLGPICRTAEDAAAVFDAIRGPDGRDRTVVDAPFNWNAQRDLRGVRVGYVEKALNGVGAVEINAMRSLAEIEQIVGAKPVAMQHPDWPPNAEDLVFEVEAATVFDELIRTNRDAELAGQEFWAWPNVLRTAHLVPAVEYIRVNRMRTKLMEAMHDIMREFDVIVLPSSKDLGVSNLTGHPMVGLPNGFDEQGLPTGVTLMGGLYAEADILALAHALQRVTDFHQKHPKL